MMSVFHVHHILLPQLLSVFFIFNWSLFSRDHSTLGQIPKVSARKEPLGIAGARSNNINCFVYKFAVC